MNKNKNNKNNKNKIIRDDAQQNTYIDCREKTCSSSGPKTKKNIYNARTQVETLFVIAKECYEMKPTSYIN
jgi:tRNA-dihydrouridine synthase